MASMTKTPSEVAYEAADHIAKYGHHKGDFYAVRPDLDPDHIVAPSCAMGAMVLAAFGNYNQWMERNQGYDVAFKRLSDTVFDSVGHVVPEWNDLESTSAEDVILMLKHVGAELENEGQ